MTRLQVGVMPRARVAIGALTFASSVGSAQTEGRWAVGPQIASHFPAGRELVRTTGLGVAYSLTRPRNRDGWYPALGLGWFGADLDDPLGGHLDVRPLLAGLGYTVVRGRMRTSLTALTGPAFNRLTVDNDERERWSAVVGGPVTRVDAQDSWAFKPGAQVTYNLRRRLGLFVGADFEFVRITLKIQRDETWAHRRLKADMINLRTGFLIGVF